MNHSQSDVEAPLHADPLPTCDLVSSVAQLKAGDTWRTAQRSTVALVKTPALRVVLVGLRAKAVLSAHRAEGTITVQLLEGRITFRALGQARELAPGQLLTLEVGIAHEVEAPEDSVFLLTMAVAKK